MDMTHYRVTRSVSPYDPHNWSGRTVDRGEVFLEFLGSTYGSCDLSLGVALDKGDGTFFEFPKDAVEVVE